MNEIQKAYVAGIIDGEGSIMLQSFHKNQLPSPCVSVASTSMELLEYIKEKISMRNIKTKKIYDLVNHKNSFTYAIYHNDAIRFLESIYPYLVIKKELR